MDLPKDRLVVGQFPSGQEEVPPIIGLSAVQVDAALAAFSDPDNFPAPKGWPLTTTDEVRDFIKGPEEKDDSSRQFEETLLFELRGLRSEIREIRDHMQRRWHVMSDEALAKTEAAIQDPEFWMKIERMERAQSDLIQKKLAD